jgi:hypothetical protein
MNTKEDEKWHALLQRSASTFEPELTPPYGFITSTLTRIREESQQVRDLERIGWRALLASFGALAMAAVVTVGVTYHVNQSDFDPGVRALIQMDNISVS